MRSRTFLLLFLAVVLAGGTARAWLAAQRSEVVEGVPVVLAPPAKSVLVARTAIRRGQILRPDEMVWQVWPEGALDKNYIVMGGPRTPDAFAGWVAQNPIAGGDPITETKIIAPGDRGYLAAVLRPGMRAISVPVTLTSGISGFIFPGDQVDLLLTYTVPAAEKTGDGDKAGGEKYQHKAAETVLRNVRVIAIDQRLESKAGEAVQAKTATFEVTPKNSEVIAVASEIGKVSLTLRSLVPGANEPSATEQETTGTANPSADLSVGAQATYTIDSEISPLLPKFISKAEAQAPNGSSAKEAPVSAAVTILRGSAKGSEATTAQPAGKGS